MLPVLINDVPVSCINHAAQVYHVPVGVILSVMKAEGGKNGDANRNKNGTVDYGVLQINSVWLPEISGHGYTKDDLQFNPCRNIEVGVWILGKSLAEGKSLWSGIANYHSRTPEHNQRYQKIVYKNYKQLMNVIR